MGILKQISTYCTAGGRDGGSGGSGGEWRVTSLYSSVFVMRINNSG